MDEPFELPVTYKNEAFLFPARLLHFGYTHRFSINVNGHEILFEPDEEGSYRALIEPGEQEEKERINVDLLKAIAAAIDEVLKDD
jgi:hypothetical protein